MKNTIKHAPPNSIIFVSDTDGGQVPDPSQWDRSLVHASSSCVCVQCYLETEGETDITLTSVEQVDVGPEFELAFDGVIETPSKGLVISDIDVDGLLVAEVPSGQTRIRVWVNDAKLPDKVVVGWG